MRFPDRVADLAAPISGVLLLLAFPFADQGWIAFVALVPLLRSIAGVTPGRAARRGFLCGLVFFSGLLSWLIRVMTHYGGLPTWAGAGFLGLLVAYLAIFFAGFAALLAMATRRRGPAALLLAPFLWVAFEFARGHLLTGFPWGLVGYSQWRNLPLLQAGAWGGVYAVSFAVLLVNAALALLFDRAVTGRARVAAAAALLLVVASEGLGARAITRLPAGDGAALTVAAVQANVAQDRKWRAGEEAAIVSRLLAQSAAAAAQGARLVVWPEASSPLALVHPAKEGAPAAPPDRDRDGFEQVGAWLRRAQVTLIAGSVGYRRDHGRLSAYNSAFVIGPDGVPGPSYDKVHLVPFGEYVPLQHLLFFVDRMVQGAVAEFAPGRSLDPLPTPVGRAGTFVCYEAIFPEQVRRLARRADFLVNITNDAWFGQSAAPRQHLAMAAVRAAENRRWLLRAANTGISAIVDPAGRVRQATPLEVETVLVGTIAPRSDRTPYARLGDGFAWGCAMLTAVVAAAHRAAFSRSGRPEPATRDPRPTTNS